MLTRTSLYLASCDSVKQLPLSEIVKRFKWALVFSEKVVVTPNILIDNVGMDTCLQDAIVGGYLKKHPKLLVLRHNHSKDQLSVLDYFRQAPPDYIVSHVDSGAGSGKKKKDLTPRELGVIEARLDRLDRVLESIQARHERITLDKNALTTEIEKRLLRCGYTDKGDSVAHRLLEGLGRHGDLSSRSDWYRYVGAEFGQEPDTLRAARSEFVDPAYNSLLIRSGEAFASDGIRRLEIPVLLSTVLWKRVHDRQIEVAREAISLAQFIHTGGLSGILGWAKEYGKERFAEVMAEKAKAGLEGVTTWVSMERRLTQWIGVEIKE